MNASKWLDNFITNQRLGNLAGHFIHAGIMACMGVSIVQFSDRLFLSVHLELLPLLCFLVGLEAAATYTSTREMDAREKIIFRGSEWVVMAVLIKAAVYLVVGFDRLATDLPLWQVDIMNFFDADYIISLGLGILVWFFTRMYAGELEILNSEPEDWYWDGGKLDNDREDARRKLLNRILGTGVLVFCITMAARMDVKAIWGDKLPFTGSAVNVVLYFALSFILFSLIQFSFLRGRWFWSKIPITGNIWQRWVKYGLIFFLLLGVLILLLPNQFAVGLFDMLMMVVNFLVQVIYWIFQIILAPLYLILSLFSVPGAEQVDATQQPQITPVPPQTATPSEPVPWLEVLKALLFWGIFIVIILSSLGFAIKRNVRLVGMLNRFHFIRWLGRLWNIVRVFFRGASRQVGQAVRAGWQRIKPKGRIKVPQRLRDMVNFRTLTPRQQVIYFYMKLLERGEKHGIRRKASQTPLQYRQILENEIPEVEVDLRGMTETFMDARYSLHEVGTEEPNRVKKWWSHIVGALSGKRNVS